MTFSPTFCTKKNSFFGKPVFTPPVQRAASRSHQHHHLPNRLKLVGSNQPKKIKQKIIFKIDACGDYRRRLCKH